MGFSRQEYWSGVPLPSPRNLFDSVQEKYVCVQLHSHVLFAITRTVAHQAPPFIEFSQQEHWSGLQFPSPGDLPNPGIEPGSPALQAES